MRMRPRLVSRTTTGPVGVGRGEGTGEGAADGTPAAWARQRRATAEIIRSSSSRRRRPTIVAARPVDSPPRRPVECRFGPVPMVLFNYSTKELTAKVVYYGP